MGKSFVYNTGASDDDKQKNDIRAEFGVFIDGTLNNLKNTETRKKIRGETDDNLKLEKNEKTGEYEYINDVVIDTNTEKYKSDLQKEANHRKAILNGAIYEHKGLKNPKGYNDYIKGVEHFVFTDNI